MRKSLLFSLLCMLVIFSACGGKTDTEQNNDPNNETNNEEGQNNENDNQLNNEGTTDENTNNNDESENTNALEDNEEQVSPTYQVNEATWSIEPIDDANEQVVLVTIDDAPDKHALEMAKTLEKLDVNAIFFVNGHFLETDEKKEILKEIYDMGFVIGNHTYSHKSLQDLTEDEQKEEIVSVNDMVEEITGERPLFFRAPFGQNTDYSKQLADEEGMTLMNWSYGYDWEADYQTQETITDIMINTELLRNGANLLMHDREWTSAGLHDIVTGLRDKGYEMVDPKLIKTKKDE